MIGLEHLREGLRFAKRALFRNEFTNYPGSVDTICHTIIEKCWNHEFFQVSAGHFNEFYMRDLGWCTQSLLKLGYHGKVKLSMRWALSHYAQQGKITTTITPRNRAIDVFSIAPDSLAYCLYVLKILKAHDLVDEFKSFLQLEINRYYNECIDPLTGLVKTDTCFSSMKDNVQRNSSLYDNCMIAMASDIINYFKLINPFDQDMKKKILHTFWCSEGYFYDDLEKESYIAADAQVFPFFCGVCTDKKKLKQCIHAIRRAGLDDPLPLKYTAKRRERNELKPMKWFAPNYEGTAIWLHMGPLYVHLVKKVDPKLAQRYKEKYKKLILEHKNFLEVLEPTGEPYKTLFYKCDESMLWAANYLTL